MKFDEIWAYSIDRIYEYFVACGAERCQEVMGFVLDGVQIRLTSMPDRKVGQLSFPQTRVVMEAESNMIPDENVERVHHAFYLNFLSGGA